MNENIEIAYRRMRSLCVDFCLLGGIYKLMEAIFTVQLKQMKMILFDCCFGFVFSVPASFLFPPVTSGLFSRCDRLNTLLFGKRRRKKQTWIIILIVC